jgi:hypothetical protein
MAKIIGIDLGTTSSLVAVVQGGKPVVILTAEGGNLCPSVQCLNGSEHAALGLCLCAAECCGGQFSSRGNSGRAAPEDDSAATGDWPRARTVVDNQ